jgi:hypothetical protein
LTGTDVLSTEREREAEEDPPEELIVNALEKTPLLHAGILSLQDLIFR